jgi:hypothetical protein
MFNAASAFNQDLSGWCVTRITSQPVGFDNGATSWTKPRPVWGTCPVLVPGELLADPAELAFGAIEVGERATRTVELSVTGTVPVGILDTSLAGSVAFQVGAVPRTVGPEQPVTVEVTFAPTTAGQHTARLDIDHDGHNTPLTISLTATAITPATRLVEASAVAIDPGRFGAAGDTLELVFDGPLDPATSPQAPTVHLDTATALQCKDSSLTCTIDRNKLTITVTRALKATRNLSNASVTGVASLNDTNQRPVQVADPVAIVVPAVVRVTLVEAKARARNLAVFGTVGDTLELAFDGALDPATSPQAPTVHLDTATALQCKDSTLTCTIDRNKLTITVTRALKTTRNLSNVSVTGVAGLNDTNQRPVLVEVPIPIQPW